MTPGDASADVLDYLGDGWRVDETRPTEHGFEIFLGRPIGAAGPMGRKVIITAALSEHFEKHRRDPGAMNIPLGQTVIKRIRAVLGHDRRQDNEQWWLDRLDDLRGMTTSDFCARHGVSMGAVSQSRQKYLGERRVRDAEWWKADKMRELLLSGAPTTWIAQSVGLAAVTVSKYRHALRQAEIAHDTD